LGQIPPKGPFLLANPLLANVPPFGLTEDTTVLLPIWTSFNLNKEYL